MYLENLEHCLIYLIKVDFTLVHNKELDERIWHNLKKLMNYLNEN